MDFVEVRARFDEMVPYGNMLPWLIDGERSDISFHLRTEIILDLRAFLDRVPNMYPYLSSEYKYIFIHIQYEHRQE